ncbi:hypothetical protein SAMN04488564_108228 [Lentzea waywayandensis]|uniref:Immunity protein Imm1 n=1 Tax=Lentzea waywayandensis TaxID=84724 RepID=A0A1I6F554_9PSEU|nr:hypothetical protein [Lentzea waywayandensis]SFR25115.1 hypothetical protein SAMN04488564_108228 [Lentzea waywayandensis]
MSEGWTIDGDHLAPDEVVASLRTRTNDGRLETWLTSSSGRLLTFVTNSERAMVMLLDGEGDAGEHAVDPGAGGESDGFVLSHGQNDTYPNADTVPIAQALRIVGHVVREGSWPADAHHVSDR